MNRRDFLKRSTGTAAGLLLFSSCTLEKTTIKSKPQVAELTNKLRSFIYSLYDEQLDKGGCIELIGTEEKISSNMEKAKKGLEQILDSFNLNPRKIISKLEKSQRVEELERFYKQYGLEFVSGEFHPKSYELRKLGSIEDCYLEDKDIGSIMTSSHDLKVGVSNFKQQRDVWLGS